MIYPTRRLVLAAAAVAPLALAVGVLFPAHWTAGLALLAFLLALGGIDALIGPGIRRASVTLDAPGAISVGADVEIEAHVRFDGAFPPIVEAAIAADPLLLAQAGQRRAVALGDGAELGEEGGWWGEARPEGDRDETCVCVEGAPGSSATPDGIWNSSPCTCWCWW